jgi:hypothetical protein
MTCFSISLHRPHLGLSFCSFPSFYVPQQVHLKVSPKGEGFNPISWIIKKLLPQLPSGQEMIPAVPPNLSQCDLSAAHHHARSVLTVGFRRRLLVAFRSAFRSPFAKAFPVAIPPSATLCREPSLVTRLHPQFTMKLGLLYPVVGGVSRTFFRGSENISPH